MIRRLHSKCTWSRWNTCFPWHPGPHTLQVFLSPPWSLPSLISGPSPHPDFWPQDWLPQHQASKPLLYLHSLQRWSQPGLTKPSTCGWLPPFYLQLRILSWILDSSKRKAWLTSPLRSLTGISNLTLLQTNTWYLTPPYLSLCHLNKW